EYLNGVTELSRLVSIVGSHTHLRLRIRLRGPIQSFGVFFRPLGLWQLFQIPANMLVNQAYAAEAILGNGVLPMWRRMAEHASFDERVRLVEEYLLGRVAKISAPNAVVSSALHILEFQGAP